MNRPEYVVCALTGVHDTERNCPEQRTWCGRTTGLMEFAFVDAGHAALNARHEGRLLLCPECARAISDIIAKGAWTP